MTREDAAGAETVHPQIQCAARNRMRFLLFDAQQETECGFFCLISGYNRVNASEAARLGERTEADQSLRGLPVLAQSSYESAPPRPRNPMQETAISVQFVPGM
eukprot:2996469-Rhodomonas_salina.1